MVNILPMDSIHLKEDNIHRRETFHHKDSILHMVDMDIMTIIILRSNQISRHRW